MSENGIADLQKKMGYDKESYNDLVNLLSYKINDGSVDAEKKDRIIEIISLATLGEPDEESDVIIDSHMDFDFSDGDTQIINFLRSMEEVGISEQDNYDEYPEKSFVGVSIYKSRK